VLHFEPPHQHTLSHKDYVDEIGFPPSSILHNFLVWLAQNLSVYWQAFDLAEQSEFLLLAYNVPAIHHQAVKKVLQINQYLYYCF